MLHLDSKKFFDAVRAGPFAGRLKPEQVSGMLDLIAASNAAGVEDVRKLAYMLATDFHETGGAMQPVRETFARTDALARTRVRSRQYGKPAGAHGHVYYGRGDVQLTWYGNYVRMGEILGIPLAANPDMALDSKYSKRILVEGMLRAGSLKGDFTGKALEEYFNTTTDDPLNARRTVNGMDRAVQIAGYHEKFLAALKAASGPAPRPSFWSALAAVVGSFFVRRTRYLPLERNLS